MGVTGVLARFAAASRYEHLSPEVVQKTKEVFIDSVGCVLAGYSLDLGKIVVEFAREQGGPPEARILGSDCAVGCVPATFANAELMNALDLDEVLLNWGHVAPYVFPAALAIAERHGASGRELLHAFAVGYDVAARVSASLAGSVVVTGTPPELFAQTPDVYGFSSNVFGTVAAVGILLGFDADKMAHAFGIAGYNAPVANSIKWAASPPVPMAKYGCAGWIAQAGLVAALLAEKGFSGDAMVLEGPYGFWKMVGSTRWAPGEAVSGLGRRWWILETSYKQYPCCRFMHHAMDLVADLVGQNGIDPDDIERIIVRLIPRATGSSIFGTTVPRDAMEAQFSVPYVVAASAYGRQYFPDLLSRGTLEDPKVLKLAARVEMAPEPRQLGLRFERYGNEPVGPMDRMPTSVEVFANGRRYSAYTELSKGDPWDEKTRFGEDEVMRKFVNCASAVLSPQRARRALEVLCRLDQISDVRELTGALCP